MSLRKQVLIAHQVDGLVLDDSVVADRQRSRLLEALGTKPGPERGRISYDLAELFSLLWLIEKGHCTSMKMAFDAAYAKFREMELADVKAVIEAAAKQVKYKDNVFIETLWRNPEALEKFVLAKWSSVRGRSQRLKQTLPNALLAKEDSF